MADTALRYTIRPGDTYYGIVASLNAVAGVTASQIAQANPGLDPAALAVGQVLVIPAADGGDVSLHYTVCPGDSYSRIATALNTCSGVTVSQIQQANPGVAATALQVGQVISIPGNEPAAAGDDNYIGYWRWTWSRACVPPNGASIGLAFSGWADVETALQNSDHVRGSLQGRKYICIGGGNDNGAFTASRLQTLTDAIAAGRLSGYEGVAYDVEVGDSGLTNAFAASFATARARNLKVLVTISHSAPYGIADGSDLMRYFFGESNIDLLSPQLYTTGKESANEYATSHGVAWSEFAGAKAKLIPSIVRAGLYADAQTYFTGQGVTLSGFVQWSQAATG